MLLHLLQSGVILPVHLLTHVLSQHLRLDRWCRTPVPWARNGAALRREHSERVIVDLAPHITCETIVAREVLGVVALALDAFANIIRVAAHGTIALVGDGESVCLLLGLHRVR